MLVAGLVILGTILGVVFLGAELWWATKIWLEILDFESSIFSFIFSGLHLWIIAAVFVIGVIAAGIIEAHGNTDGWPAFWLIFLSAVLVPMIVWVVVWAVKWLALGLIGLTILGVVVLIFLSQRNYGVAIVGGMMGILLGSKAGAILESAMLPDPIIGGMFGVLLGATIVTLLRLRLWRLRWQWERWRPDQE